MYATKNICMQQKIYVCNKNYMYATKKYIYVWWPRAANRKLTIITINSKVNKN